MPRPIRIEYPGAIYHIMSRGVARMPTFQDDQDRILFLNLIGEMVEKGALIIHAFCLMPNHYHLLSETPLGELHRWMHQILSRYAFQFNRKYDRVGHLWQGRYKAILVEDGQYFVDCSRYIHLNPYRSLRKQDPEFYPWSSYRNFLRLGGVVDWVCTERILSFFDSPEHYKSFVESGKDQNLQNPLDQAVGGLALGSPDFIRRMRKAAEALQSKSKVRLPGLQSILRQTAPAFSEELRGTVEIIFSDWSQCQRRRMLMYVLKRYTWMSVKEIADLIGRTPGAVSQAVRDIASRLRFDSGLKERLKELERKVPDL